MVNSTSQAAQTAGSTDAPQTGAVTDPVVGAFLRHLREQDAPVVEVLCSLDDAYLIYTEVDSKSASALDKVYRAELETQKDFPDNIFGRVVLVFEHRNRALGGQEVRDEFLGRGSFVRIT